MTSCYRKQLNVAQCKGIKDSGPHSVDSGFKYLSVELGFWIQNVSGIPDSTSKIFPDSWMWIPLRGAVNASFNNPLKNWLKTVKN